jgi:hypothetical protein
MLKSAIPVDNSPYVFGYMVNNGLSLGDKTKKKMIKASELRIGNLLEFSNGIEPAKIVMVGRRFFSSAAIEKEDGDFNVTPYYRGIPLTEEWLIRFGFLQGKSKYGNDFSILNEDGFTVMFSIEHWIDVEETSVWKNHWHTKGLLNKNKLQFVHQLQNLFFALTGKELILDHNSTSSTLPDSTTAK